MGVVIHGEDAIGGTGTGYIGVFTNYTDLITQFPVGPSLLALAYVQNSQGTPWLPGGMGGTFYSKGTYLWDGVAWVDGLDEVSKEIQDILDTMNTQTLFDVLTEGNSAGGLNIKMGLASILFGSTDLVSMSEDGAGSWKMLNNSGAFSGWSMVNQNGTTLASASMGFTQLLLEQTGLLDSGKILLEFALADPKIILQSDIASGGKKQQIQTIISPTADRLHQLQNRDGTLAHLDQIGLASLKEKSGVVLNASFSGNPKKTAAIAFGTAFADANYSVVVTAHTQNNASYALSVESILAGSFIINAGANNINDLIDVRWIAIKHGEN